MSDGRSGETPAKATGPGGRGGDGGPGWVLHDDAAATATAEFDGDDTRAETLDGQNAAAQGAREGNWVRVSGKEARAILGDPFIGAEDDQGGVTAAGIKTSRNEFASKSEIEARFELQICLNESGEDRASRSDHPRGETGPVAILSDGARGSDNGGRGSDAEKRPSRRRRR